MSGPLPEGDDLLLLIRAALDQSRSAACITTADLGPDGPTIVYVNPAYSRMTGYDTDEALGATPRIMQGPLTDRRVLDRLSNDLANDRPFVGEAINYRKDGTPFLISWRIDPVRDSSGRLTHYIANQEDITDARRMERRASAEQAIDRSLSTVLSHPARTELDLRNLTHDVASALSLMVDFGRVSVVAEVRLGMSRTAITTGPEFDAIDSVTRSVGQPGHPPPFSTGVNDDGHWLGYSLTSHRSGVVGAIVVSGLTKDELAFIDLDGLARATETARRALYSLAEYERQRHVAVELQRSLLPPTAPEIPGFLLSARYQPGAFATRVGGDWYDVFTDDHRAVLVVGDMAGSGIRAASDMGRVRLMSRVLLQQGLDVPEMLVDLNHFCRNENLMATLLALTIDLEGDPNQILASTAGHPPPIVRLGRNVEIPTLVPGPLLGFGGQPTYPERTLQVEADDMVVMFTDGLVESRGETLDDGLHRLVGRIEKLPRGLDQLCDQLIADRLEEDPQDDIALLAVEVVGRS